MTKRVRRVFTKEFKVEAVRLAQAGEGSVASVARNLGVHVTTLRDWIRSSEAEPEDSVSKALNETLLVAQLRKELATATMERDILKNHPRAGSYLLKQKLPVWYRNGSQGGVAVCFLERNAIPKKTWSRDCCGLKSGDARSDPV